MRAFFTFAALTACALSSGCAVAAGAAVAESAVVAMQQRTMGEAVDDTTAASEIRMRLFTTDRAGFAAVHVEAQAGSVLLWGDAPDEQHRQTAEMIARSVRSVHALYNEIEIGDHRTIARNADDTWISTQIRTRLTASPHVHGVDVDIETFRGNVYLLGVVRSQDELQHAAEIASLVPGVRRVVSFMQTRAVASPTYAAERPEQTAYAGSR